MGQSQRHETANGRSKIAVQKVRVADARQYRYLVYHYDQIPDR
jgi:hypothetical protein